MDRDDVLVFGIAALGGWAVARIPGIVIAVSIAAVVRTVRRRRAASVSPILIEERFADAVGALAAAVRSGASLMQAIRYAATEAAPPVRDDLADVVEQLDTGIALDQALRSWSAGRPNANVELVVGALELHRRSGGDLPAVLDQVVGAVRDRVSISREVRSLTAQARMSAWILGLLPVGFFAFLWLTSRRDIEGAMSTPVGIACVVVGLLLELGAFAWIRKLLVVE
ncbi:MAG TPA: type II secretion system F family protein [Actinomycetota bacterium]|nr:type II secretion system F family protein [Actinomycetota bacterium]